MHFIMTMAFIAMGYNLFAIQSSNQLSLNTPQQKLCPGIIIDKNSESFVDSVFNITASEGNGFLKTGIGFQVDKNCVKKWGPSFIPVLKTTKKNGLKCLKENAEMRASSKQNLGVSKNIQKIETILNPKLDQVQIICSDDDYEFGWSSTTAHASTSNGASVIGMKHARHPFISINPIDLKGDPNPDQLALIKKTVFHELFHSIGYKHGEDIEYAYACSVCCFEDMGIIEKAKACKICRGDSQIYKDFRSTKYTEDHVDMFKSLNAGILSLEVVREHLRTNEKSVDGLIEHARANSDKLNSIGSYLTEAIMMNGVKLDKDQQEKIYKVMEVDNRKVPIQTAGEVSKWIAQSVFELYYNKDGVKAMSILEKNKDKIIKHILSLNEQTDNREMRRVSRNLTENIDAIITDIWLNKYPGDKKSMNMAYELNTYMTTDK